MAKCKRTGFSSNDPFSQSSVAVAFSPQQLRTSFRGQQQESVCSVYADSDL